VASAIFAGLSFVEGLAIQRKNAVIALACAAGSVIARAAQAVKAGIPKGFKTEVYLLLGKMA